VDDRKLFWKKNPKLIFCGFIIALMHARKVLFELTLFTWGQPPSAVQKSIGRIKSEGQRKLTQDLSAAAAKFKRHYTENTEVHRATPQRNAVPTYRPLWHFLCETLCSLWSIFAKQFRSDRKKIMRSGPATRTARCRMNFTRAL
jgi:hypothetical protein